MKKRLRLMTVLAVILTAAAILPVAAAITRFTDVPDSNIFAEDIAWMDENEITTGCGPDIFCPTANVTREQMSAFMHRLATKQVVDAKTLEGMAASDFAAVGHNHDADYLPVNGTAVDANSVNGLVASDLIRVASYSFSTPKHTNDYAELAFFDIEAPVEGYLILSSSLQYHTNLNTEVIYCAFEVDGVFVNGSATSIDVYNPVAGISGPCASHATIPVAAGSHTITIMGFYHTPFETQFSWGNASALFVPFGATGNQPVDFEAPAPSPDQLP